MKISNQNSVKRNIWIKIRPFVIVVIGIIVVLIIVFGTYNYVYDNFLAPVDPESNAVIEIDIPKSSSLSTIANILYENGLIKSEFFFKIHADFSDMSYKLKAGTYDLSPSMTYDDIMYTLIKGMPPAVEVTFTFVEGSTVKSEAEQLTDTENGGILESADTFLALCKDGKEFISYSFIKDVIDKADNRNYVLDGYLFPDTYRYYSDASETEIITKQLDRFNEIFNEQFRERAEELGMTIDDVIILASIIEKEAITSDFAKVSAVFHNRLNQDMVLGSCATMQVVTGQKKYTFTSDELSIDSPYNTYLYKGLPVGPICNPGRAAIEAALYPDEDYINDVYLYFCLTTPETGEQVFAKTYEEHLANQEQWEQYW